jgi:hypothetical protein
MTEDVSTVTGGNVLADLVDADANDVHDVVGVVAGNGPAPTNNTGVGSTITGIYGDLTIDANGEASYTLRFLSEAMASKALVLRFGGLSGSQIASFDLQYLEVPPDLARR